MGRLIFLLVIGLTGLGVLVSLGIWQSKRLIWKEDILATIEARIADAPGALPQAPDPVADKYMPVNLTGSVEPGELHVLTSVRDVGAGYRVIAPFVTEDGRRILLDRGFIRDTRKDEARSIGPASVTGNLHWPQETDSYTPEADREANIWFARDVALMAAALDTLPIMVVSRQGSEIDQGLTPLPVDTASIPNDHLQYAITWFSLAAIWAAMTFYFLWRTGAKSEG